MTSETLNNLPQLIEQAQHNIKHLQKSLRTLKDKDNTLLDALYKEYDHLAQLQLDQSVFLKKHWETYRKDEKARRKADIESRQIEFDKELDLQDQERRKKWILQKPDTTEKINLCQQLLTALGDESKLEIVNETEAELDTSLLILPMSMLASFWSLDLEPPVLKSEIGPTLQLLTEIKASLE
ncbi:hypothetical protein BY458DRAFT_183745 [Sporodiniella umbellata]|nr:hypothetical protein BY458DRAFT_183745 [Sporodiniella umbellata]